MRVIAGKLKGQQFASPRTRRTHPMSDKARGALFNVLGDVEGLRFLDAFAGTGAIAIEAVSRGAREAVAVEKDTRAYKVLHANVEKLNLSNIKTVRANVASWISSQMNTEFDVIVCDPPYNHLQPETIRKLAKRLSSTGILIVSWPSSEELIEIESVRYLKSHTYSTARIIFYTA